MTVSQSIILELISFSSSKEKQKILLWLATFSFVINYLFFDFFYQPWRYQNSLLSKLLDMAVHRQVNVHHKYISIGSNFSAKLCETRFKINKFNLSCIG